MAGFNHFKQIAASLHSAEIAIVDETTDELVTAIQEKIQSNGQVDTGYMLSSVHKEDGGHPMTKEVHIDAYYWVYQNYGTRYLPARPFVEPSVDLMRSVFQAKLAAIEGRL